jgi:hypothetical protein
MAFNSYPLLSVSSSLTTLLPYGSTTLTDIFPESMLTVKLKDAIA